MSSDERYLPVSANLASKLEPLRKSGLIERFVGGPEPSMDHIIQTHLDKVALLEARGDKSPERPIYIFNPDSRLLISYSMRHIEDDPENKSPRSGLFAEVVELDEEGKLKHGVSVVNPFETTTGFIQTEIGDNPYGFTPSYLTIEANDPFSLVPPNLSIAELMAFQQQMEPISANETLKQFLGRISDVRAEQRQKMAELRTKRYPGTLQSFDEETNPYLHLIIADRDASELAAISRSIGLFPIVRTVDEIIEAHRTVLKFSSPEFSKYRDEFSLGSGSWLGEVLPKTEGNTPAFITFDYPYSTSLDPETGRPLTVQSLTSDNPSARPDRFVLIDDTIDSLTRSNPVFARLKSPRINDVREADDNDRFYKGREKELELDIREAQTVKKYAHGDYEQIINPDDPEGMQNYADWLRKVRLDMALTLYLRGISQL